MREKSYEQLRSGIETRKKELSMIENELNQGKSYRTKPRHPDEEEILVKLALNHWRRAVETGAIVRLGPGRWRVEV